MILLNQRIEENSDRRSGNTTRLLDYTVQSLFTNNKPILLLFNYRAQLDEFEEKLHTRFRQEHRSGMTVKDGFAMWDKLEHWATYRLVYTRINGKSKDALLGRHFEDKDGKDQRLEDLYGLTDIPFLKIELQYRNK